MLLLRHHRASVLWPEIVSAPFHGAKAQDIQSPLSGAKHQVLGEDLLPEQLEMVYMLAFEDTPIPERSGNTDLLFHR